MALVKRADLTDMICKHAHITRKTPRKQQFTKRELLQLNSYLVMMNDLTGAHAEPPGDGAKKTGREKTG